MREIKFRAWSKSAKAFIAGFNMVNFHSYYNSGQEPSIYRYASVWKLSEIELMQFTGLLDKNGKEIYESDIVKAWIDFGPGGEHLETFAVTLSPFGVNIQEWNYTEKRLPEVIGNVHENPDLLTKL